MDNPTPGQAQDLRIMKQKAELQEAIYKSKNEKLKYEKNQGEVISKENAEQEFLDFSIQVKETIEQIPQEVAPLICQALKIDLDNLYQIEIQIEKCIETKLNQLFNFDKNGAG